MILEPQAVGDLVQLLAFSLDARSADDGRSAFTKIGGRTKIGEKIVDSRVNLTTTVKNLRFSESPLFMLNNLEMLGRADRVIGTEAGGNVVFPALKVKDFNFTSLSDAV